jgi:hypothetical protein
MKKIITQETRNKIKATKEETNKKLFTYEDFIIGEDKYQFILSKKSDASFYRYFDSMLGVISFIKETINLANAQAHTSLSEYIDRLEKSNKAFETKTEKVLLSVNLK